MVSFFGKSKEVFALGFHKDKRGHGRKYVLSMDSTVEYYTLYNETDICSYPFPFPAALLRVISNLKNGAPSCMPLGWWLIVWLQSYASWSPALLGSVLWCFSAVCGSWHMTLQTLFPFKHTHIISSVTISCASCFLLCRKFNLRFFLLGEDSQL